MSAIYIETERLILRAWNASDRVAFAEMNANEEVMRYFPRCLTAAESHAFVDRIEAELSANGYGLFAVELKSTGDFIGYVGFHQFTFDCPFAPGWEIGWRISDRYWHRGYATEAASACMERARVNKLFDKVYSFTAVPNDASERVMKRIGMDYVGRFNHPALPTGHWLEEHVLYQHVF